MTDTLVLSAAYEPMDQVTWQRAMSLWFTGRVEVVEEYDDRICRTPSTEFFVPSVIRFCTALRRRRRTVKFSKDNVYLRDRGRCQYCGRQVTLTNSTYDHVVPKAKGGKTTWKNIVIACVPCNQHKRDRTPAEAGMRLRSKPIRPKHLLGMTPDVIRFRDPMPEVWKPYLGVS
jgi:5-methylcytosine-specific restriction endonuclease McrA